MHGTAVTGNLILTNKGGKFSICAPHSMQ
jgi:hypothetical protein